jgi:hypothetical protein
MTRWLAAGLLGLAIPVRADLIVLVGGDRITGQVVAKGTKRVRVQTPYGLLVIPREKVECIKKDDGTEEVLNASAPPPTPTPPAKRPPKPPVRLALVVSGASFWQAWDPKAAPADPSLRLLVQLDGRTIGAYRDPILDPEDLPKATVNTFVFLPDSVARESAPGIKLLPPEMKPGRVQLLLELPPAEGAPHTLRLSYQANEGPFDTPKWLDLIEGALDVSLASGAPATVHLTQGRGSMEFVKKRMQAVETFVMHLDTPPPAP